MHQNDDDLLTVTDAAQLAGVHPRTLYRWIDEGKIDSVEVHPTCRVRVRREAIDAARQPRERRVAER